MARLPWDNPNRIEKGEKYIRERSADPYHTARWTRLSRAFRADHPLCAECCRKGIIKPATCVDHIVPWPICADRFYDRTNLQALCDECNHLKPGAVLIARDGRRFTFLDADGDGCMLLKYGPGQDEVSWWGADGRAEYDDPGFVSDADIVGIESTTLF